MSTLYDFLFVDEDRMRSLYAQLYEGLLDAMSFDDAKTVSKITEVQAGGDPIAHVNRTTGNEVEQRKQESMVPHDLILRDVLSALTEKKLILKDHKQFQVGSIALFQGDLAVLDIKILLKLLQAVPQLVMTAFKNSSSESAHSDQAVRLTKHQKKSEKRKEEAQAKAEENNTRKMIEALWQVADSAVGSITPIVQLRLSMADFEVWGAVRERNMRASIDNLTMQHGVFIPGQWHMLGIIDDICSDSEVNKLHRPLNGMFDALGGLVGSLKEMFPRPDDSFCVTPLVVFRTLCNQ